MKLKSLVPLIVVFAVLAGLVVLKQTTKEQPTIVDQVKLAPLVPEGAAKKDVAVLELYAGAKPDEKIVLTQSGDDPNVWRVTSHFNAPADKDKIEKFIDKVLELKGELRATVPDDKALAPYQLADDEAFHVKGLKKDAKDAVFDVLVGKAPAYNQVFMRAEGTKDVYTLDANLRREAGLFSEDMAAAPTPESWINKTVVNIAKNTISKIAVQTPDKRFVVAKEKTEVPADQPADQPADEAAKEAAPAGDAAKPEGTETKDEKKPETKTEEKWVLAEGGAGGTPKPAGIENLAGAFAPLTATDVVDPAKLTDWGLDAPEFTCALTVDGHDGDVVIEGGRPDPNGDGYVRVATADKSVVFKLPKYTFEKVFMKGRDLVDLPSIKADKATISQIDITQPEGNISLTKSGDSWTIVTPVADLKTQTATLDSLAAALASWQAADYADSADGKGLDAPARSVTFTTASGESHTIATGADSADSAGRYARLDGSGTVLVMSKSDSDRIFVAPKDIYNHSVLDIKEDDIARISVSRAEDGFTLSKEGEAWTLTVDGASSPADESAAGAVATALASFQVSDIAFGQPDLTTSVDTTVQVVMKDGSEHVLRIGPDENGSHAVAVNGKAETFRAQSMDIKEIAPASATLKEKAPAETSATTEPKTENPAAPEVKTEAPADSTNPAPAESAQAPATEQPQQ